MSEIEERLRALEEKNVALEKRVAAVEAFQRVVRVGMEAEIAMDDAKSNAKTKRDVAITGVGEVFKIMLAALPDGQASKTRANIALNPGAMARDTLVQFAGLAGIPAMLSDTLRLMADVAREHNVTLGELTIP